MNKKMRELLAKIDKANEEAKSYIEGEEKSVEKAKEALAKVDALKEEYAVAKALYENEKEINGPDNKEVEKVNKETKTDGFVALAKALRGQPMSEKEKALLVPSDEGNGVHGEGNLLPHDVQLTIRELRRQHLAARDLLTVMTVGTLSGQYTYAEEAEPKLSPLTDGDTIKTADAPKFTNKQWTIDWYATILPVSNILLGAERAQLTQYLDRWFVRSAINTENEKIFEELKKFNGGRAKAITGWRELKQSIMVDLDPSMLYDAAIVTNQTGFALLDAEEDENGRPMLQVDPANPTRRVFQGLPVIVFPDAQLKNIGKDGKAPIFYGSFKEGLVFKSYQDLQFAISEHYFFNKNQTALRVMEGFTILRQDEKAVVYGTFAPSKVEEDVKTEEVKSE